MKKEYQYILIKKTGNNLSFTCPTENQARKNPIQKTNQTLRVQLNTANETLNQNCFSIEHFDVAYPENQTRKNPIQSKNQDVRIQLNTASETLNPSSSNVENFNVAYPENQTRKNPIQPKNQDVRIQLNTASETLNPSSSNVEDFNVAYPENQARKNPIQPKTNLAFCTPLKTSNIQKATNIEYKQCAVATMKNQTGTFPACEKPKLIRKKLIAVEIFFFNSYFKTLKLNNRMLNTTAYAMN